MRLKKLERIRAKREKLEAVLRELAEQEQTQADYRAAIIGRAVLAEAELDAAFRDQLNAILDRSVSGTKERKLLGLGASSRRGRRRATETVTDDVVLDLERSGV